MELGTPKGKAKSEINVTPLIDIVLVLLIVFIVMIPGLTKALNVVVPRLDPQPVPVKPDPAHPPVVVTIQKLEGGSGYQFLLQSEPVPLGELASRLEPVVLRQVPGFRKVFLKVDGEAPYQVAVDALDQIRRASDQAKARTLTRSSVDGGDVKVVVSVRK